MGKSQVIGERICIIVCYSFRKDQAFLTIFRYRQVPFLNGVIDFALPYLESTVSPILIPFSRYAIVRGEIGLSFQRPSPPEPNSESTQ